MINPDFFNHIKEVHDNDTNLKLLNLILGTYQEIEALDKKTQELEAKINKILEKMLGIDIPSEENK